MSETLFYQLERSTLEEVLTGLLERTRGRGQRAVVRAGSAERMAALDTHLWTYSESTFLAHGTVEAGVPARQPIYLTTEEENPNGAEVLFLVGGAWPSAWNASALKAHARIVVLFDGHDGAALENARAGWKAAKDAGHEVTFWKQSDAGKWEKQG